MTLFFLQAAFTLNSVPLFLLLLLFNKSSLILPINLYVQFTSKPPISPWLILSNSYHSVMTKQLCNFSQDHKCMSACTYRRTSINLDWLLVSVVFLAGGGLIRMKLIKTVNIVADFDFRVSLVFFPSKNQSLKFGLDLRCYTSLKLHSPSLISLTNISTF